MHKRIHILSFIILMFLVLSACQEKEEITVESYTEKIYNDEEDILIDSKYQVYNYDISDGFFVIKKIGKKDTKSSTNYAYMDLNGNILNDTFYSSCFPFNEGLASVVLNLSSEEKTKGISSKVVYINKKGEVVIDRVAGNNISFLDYIYFKSGITSAAFIDENNEVKNVIFNTNGEVVDVPKINGEKFVSYPNSINFGKFVKCPVKSEMDYTYDTDLYYYDVFELENQIYKNMEIFVDDNDGYDVIFVLDRLAGIKDDEYLLLDSKGEVLKNFTKEYGSVDFVRTNPLYKNEDLAINFTNKNSIIVDFDGNLITETNYKNLGRVYKGYVSFEKNGKVGLLNTKGELILPAEYDAISNVYENKVLINKDGKNFIRTLKS